MIRMSWWHSQQWVGRLTALVCSALLSGCPGSTSESTGPNTGSPPPHASAEPVTQRAFTGFCEASAVIAYQGGFVVADNESDSVIYPFSEQITPRDQPPPADVDVRDVEALVDLPQGLLLVGSQSTKDNGEVRPKRERVQIVGKKWAPVDFAGCDECVAAHHKPPKMGGLSVEGAALWNGALWFGLRSPLVQKKAILLKMAGDPATGLTVSEKVQVDLNEFGVRDLTVHDGALWILAGPADGSLSAHRLYSLAGIGAAPQLVRSDLPEQSEGIAFGPNGALLVVTDGEGKPGEACVKAATWRWISPVKP